MNQFLTKMVRSFYLRILNKFQFQHQHMSNCIQKIEIDKNEGYRIKTIGPLNIIMQTVLKYYQRFFNIDYKIRYISFIIILIVVQVKMLSAYSSELEQETMKKFIYEMKYHEELWDDQSIQSKAFFADTILQHPDNEFMKLIEKFRFNQLYNIDQYNQKQELPLCISIVGLASEESYSKMLSSVFRQDYSNYKIAFIDDKSAPNVVNMIEKYIAAQIQKKQKEGKNIKIASIFNKQKKYALRNRHQSIVDYCSENDIIVDVDADDELIGSYAFQLINAMYQRQSQAWVIYFNLMFHKTNTPKMNIDICGPISDEAFQNNSYRTSNTWKSTALKTFRRDLYMKIDPIDYFDSQGQYYVEKPDAFIHYALVELAGKEHTLKVDEPLYYYNYDTLDKERRSLKQQKSLASLAATMLTPYQALNSLGDKPKRVQSYVIPQNYIKRYKNLFADNSNLKNNIRVRP